MGHIVLKIMLKFIEMRNLKIKAFGGLVFLLIVMASAIFISAGTIIYQQAWMFLTVFGTATTAITIYLMIYDARLLERRVNAGPAAEKEKSQKIIQSIASFTFLLVFIIPAIDFRFKFSQVSPLISLIGDAFVALGLFIVFLVFRENSFTSGTIKVESNQKIITTGLYSFIRHPMYTGAIIMLTGVPIGLGSLWGILSIIPLIFIIILRLVDEERLLERELPGYTEYQKRVTYRLIPGIW